MKKTHLLFTLAFPLLAACQPKSETSMEMPTTNLRELISSTSTLALNEEIEQVEYIPLRTTDDSQSLLDGAAGFAVTSKYIYVYPVKEQRIALFSRQGEFIRTLITFGQGPGEFNDMLSDIQADEKRNKLYLFGVSGIWEYTLEGEYLQKHEYKQQALFQRFLTADRLGAVAFPYMPFSSGSFGLGVFTLAGDTVAMKNDFHSSEVASEKAGFTIRLASAFTPMDNSILFKMGANDTVFRVTEKMIEPACVLQLNNSEKEIRMSIDATDFGSMQNFGSSSDLIISDMMETPSCIYFRLRYDEGHFVVSLNKQSGKTLVERCVQPADLATLSDANLLCGMLGTRSYRNFPIWGRMESGCLAQVITPYELGLYKETGKITVPDALQEVGEDDNPIVILYHLK